MCSLLKKSSGNPYLKILDFSQLLVADTPIKFCFRKILRVGYVNELFDTIINMGHGSG